jgi:hypothetical protein
MKQRVLWFLSGASLAIVCAIVGLWVRSYSFRDSITTQHEWPRVSYFSVRSSRGYFGIITRTIYWSPWPDMRHWQIECASSDTVDVSYARDGGGTAELIFDHFGVRFTRVKLGDRGVDRHIYISFWFLVAVGVALPLWQARMLFRHWRAQLRCHKGLCAHCSYDLRGSRDRCPECGKPVPRAGAILTAEKGTSLISDPLAIHPRVG